MTQPSQIAAQMTKDYSCNVASRKQRAAETHPVNAMRWGVAGMKLECEGDLAEAMPILNEALAALDTIKDADIQYVKKLGNPPALIKLVMEVRIGNATAVLAWS